MTETKNDPIGVKDVDETLGPASSDDFASLKAERNSLLAARRKVIDQDREERKNMLQEHTGWRSVGRLPCWLFCCYMVLGKSPGGLNCLMLFWSS